VRVLVNVAGTVAELTDPLQLPTLDSDPDDASGGWLYYNTTTHRARMFDGTTWRDIA
jgi:hypothetical protein